MHIRKPQNQACVSTESGLITVGGTNNNEDKPIAIYKVSILKEDVWQVIGKLNKPSFKNAAIMVGNYIFVTAGKPCRYVDGQEYRATERLEWHGSSLTSNLLSFEPGYALSPIVFQVPIDFCL